MLLLWAELLSYTSSIIILSNSTAPEKNVSTVNETTNIVASTPVKGRETFRINPTDFEQSIILWPSPVENTLVLPNPVKVNFKNNNKLIKKLHAITSKNYEAYLQMKDEKVEKVQQFEKKKTSRKTEIGRTEEIFEKE